MSKSFKDLNSLFAHLEKETAKSIQKKNSNTANTVVKAAKDSVQEHVYDVYPNPVQYQRTGELKENWEVYPTSEGIEVVSERYDDDVYVSEVVHSGRGYEHPFPYYGVPRPFVDEAVRELKGNRNSELRESFKKDLKDSGFNIK